MAERNVNRARGSNSGKSHKLSVPKAQERVLQALKDGLTVVDAMKLVDRQASTYTSWRKESPEFRAKVDAIREQASAARRRGGEVAAVPDFEEFSATYLGQPVPLHHLRTLDMLRGKEPRELHPSMTYNKGRANYVIVNYPPDHAKSTTFSVNYPTWQIIDRKSVV